MKIDNAYWIDWRSVFTSKLPEGHIYLGEETCERLLPHVEQFKEIIRIFKKDSRPFTFVTPFLSDQGLINVCKLIEIILQFDNDFEVVCNDWGLVQYLSHIKFCKPIIGRLLTGQQTDPRIMRILNTKMQRRVAQREVVHADGTVCLLQYKSTPLKMKRHYQSCSIDRALITSYLNNKNIHRCEISNVGQGIHIQKGLSLVYTLHIPNVLVTVCRFCPGEGEDFTVNPSCNINGICGNKVEWQNTDVGVPLFRSANAIYYQWSISPANFYKLPIDRVVYDKR